MLIRVVISLCQDILGLTIPLCPVMCLLSCVIYTFYFACRLLTSYIRDRLEEEMPSRNEAQWQLQKTHAIQQRLQLMGKFFTPMCVVQEDADKLRDQLEEEELSRSEAQRQLQKTQAEMAAMQQRLEGSMAGAAQQELDELKRKLNARVQEGTISNIFIYSFI